VATSVKSISGSPLRRQLQRTLVGGAALLALAAAAGCATSTPATPVDYDYRVRHPIMISEEPEVLDLRVGMNGPALSPEIETAIRNYVDEYRVHGTGAISIQAPVASANEIAASSTGRAVHYALVRAGVPQNLIQVVPYHVGDHSKVASLRLSYLRVKAVAPRCGVWPDASTANFRNAQMHNFGCASQQNLAAMVANPADLVWPQPMTPANGARRANVISDYQQGLDPKSDTTLIDSEIGD
jgi:pilus assembly protein CpaD